MPESPEERRAIEDLLPFYLNGSLDEEERDRVERALDEDPSLQTELDFLVKWRRTVKDTAQDQGVGEMGERRLLRSIREAEREVRPPAPAAEVTSLSRFLRPALALAAGLALVAQTATIWNLQDELDRRGDLQTLSGGAVFKVQFDPDAREADLRAFLLDRGLVIVEGPTALGFYELEATQEDPAEEDLADLLEALQGAPDLFDYAERQGP